MQPELWSIRIDFATRPSEEMRLKLEAVMEALGAALSSFEEGQGWRMETLAEAKPDAAAVRAALKPFAVTAKIAKVVARDWVAESQRGLHPIAVGPFFIHGAHDRDKAPKGKIVLALLRLKKTHRFRKPLDIGTGTGILAFAAWYLFRKPVLAGDNDKDAVRVARENAALNGLRKAVKVVRSDGYRAAAIRDGGPYDLIVANILANPLIALAPDLRRNLARNGRAVLSGLLRAQEQDVLAAHRAVGLTLDFRLRLGEWSVLVLKPGRAR
jgi:ribosomal protein L11 methyltransferase